MKLIIIDGDKPGYGGASRNLDKIKLILEKDYSIDILNLNLYKNKSNGLKKKQSYTLFLFIEIIKFFFDFYHLKKELKITNDHDIFLVKNYRFIPYLKFFKKKVIFFCSGYSITENLSSNNKDIYKIILDRKFLFSPYEYLSLILSDKVISNSDLNYKLMTSNLKFNHKKVFIFYTSKFLDALSEVKNFSLKEKKNDLLYSASNIHRVEKNYELAISIMKSIKLNNLNKAIITSSKINLSKKIMVFDYLSREEFYKILYESKMIIIPSKFDSSPNVFYEAIYNNCIPIISNTCGVRHYDQELVLNVNQIDDWANIVLKVLSNYDYFIKKLITYKNQLVSEQRKMELNFKKIIKYEL